MTNKNALTIKECEEVLSAIRRIKQIVEVHLSDNNEFYNVIYNNAEAIQNKVMCCFIEHKLQEKDRI